EIAALPAFERARQSKAVGVARARCPFDCRPAGIAQTDQLSRLVKRLSGGVVERRAEADITPDTCARQELAMPAGNQEEKIGKGNIISQASRQSVRFEMVNRDKRLVGGPCDALRGHSADNQTANQTRARGGSYAINLCQCDVGRSERAVDYTIKVIEVGPRRDLRHDSAEGRMLDLLPMNLV